MLIQEIMKKEVVTISKDDSAFDASIKYRDYKVGCLVVVDKQRCVGVVTERDLIERVVCEKRNPEETKVEEIMSRDVKTIHRLSTVEDAIKLMKKYNIKKLPVVSDDMLVGIVTITDISHARPELSKRFIDSWVKIRWQD
ncbi:MAG: CBS domain-containing protein [Thermoplasmata archaeon]|nr:CBS domain-containing protein [Thermoplasmata archaeon]RLF27665.1 MAG: CBS domain-containing protein [Thermoplasmata archaeon]